MSREPLWRRYLRFWRSDVDRDIDDELEFHFSSRMADLIAGGLTPTEARKQVLEEFGNEQRTRARLREIGHRRERRAIRMQWWESFGADLRYGARRLLRAPFVSTVAILSLALGIGANTATFSVVRELLLRPIPAKDPGQLVNLGAPGPKPGTDNWGPAGTTEDVFSYPMFRDLARSQAPFTDIAAHRLFYANIGYRDRTLFSDVLLVSGSYFPVLGIRPALGRLLTEADDRSISGSPSVVLSHAYWAATLGADSSVIGSPIIVNGKPFTVVGVGPVGFEGTTLGVRPRVFLPITSGVGVDSNLESPRALEDRRSYQFYLFARLKPGMTIARAQALIDPLYRGILHDVEAPLQHELSPATLARFRAKRIAIVDGARGQSLLRRETREPLLLLFAITAIVVLTACANVANLMLARGATRAAEMAVRLSLGAARRRLLAQLLTEAGLLALVGGAAALLVARGTLALIAALLPKVEYGKGAAFSLSLEPTAALFAAAVALGTGLLFGLFPALHATRADLTTAIRASTGQPSGARAAARFRSSLVTGQIALSTALLIAAGLFLTSLRNVGQVPLGVSIERVVQFALAPGFNGKGMAAANAVYRDVERAVAAIPGVRGIAASIVPLFTGSTSGASVRVEGFRRDPDTDAGTRIDEVGPGFFEILSIPLLAGREFTVGDRLGAPKVAIVNEAFARKFGLGSTPIGKRMAYDGTGSGPALDMEIVGLVRDSHYSGVKDGEPPIVYTPTLQDSALAGTFYYVRTKLDPTAVLSAIRGVVSRVDPNLPVVGLKPLTQQVRENVYLDRMIGTLSAAFAVLATLLAAIGLYGVLAYTVTSRVREIGVRIALGADGGRVRGMVLGQVARLTLVGGAIGVAVGLAVGRAAESLLFGLDGHDPLVIGSAVVILSLVAFAAGYVPAWRASRVDPIRALRYE